MSSPDVKYHLRYNLLRRLGKGLGNAEDNARDRLLRARETTRRTGFAVYNDWAALKELWAEVKRANPGLSAAASREAQRTVDRLCAGDAASHKATSQTKARRESQCCMSDTRRRWALAKRLITGVVGSDGLWTAPSGDEPIEVMTDQERHDYGMVSRCSDMDQLEAVQYLTTRWSRIQCGLDEVQQFESRSLLNSKECKIQHDYRPSRPSRKYWESRFNEVGDAAMDPSRLVGAAAEGFLNSRPTVLSRTLDDSPAKKGRAKRTISPYWTQRTLHVRDEERERWQRDMERVWLQVPFSDDEKGQDELWQALLALGPAQARRLAGCPDEVKQWVKWHFRHTRRHAELAVTRNHSDRKNRKTSLPESRPAADTLTSPLLVEGPPSRPNLLTDNEAAVFFA